MITGYEPSYIIFDELTNLGVDYDKEHSSPETQVIYVIAASFHAAAILAVQIWKRGKGHKIYEGVIDTLRAYENQPVPMRKRYFPYKVCINGLGFVTEVEQFKNKSLDRNKGGL